MAVNDVARRLSTNTETGLDAAEASFASRDTDRTG